MYLEKLKINKAVISGHNNPGYMLRKLKGIVVHYTGNYNLYATAMANRNYFNTTDVNASSQFITDDKEIVQCTESPLNVCWHAGSWNGYTPIGKAIGETVNGKWYGPNHFLIGIEMCVNKGDTTPAWEIVKDTTAQLVAALMLDYNLDISKLYRHYDITGKICPRALIDEKAWTSFKNLVNSKLNAFKYNDELKRKEAEEKRRAQIEATMVGPFVDIPANTSQWEKDILKYANEVGIVNGYPANDGFPGHMKLGYGEILTVQRGVAMMANLHKSIMSEIKKLKGE